MKAASDLEAYRYASLLPRQLLHPAIAGKVVPLFIRGDYDTAVFQAFKEVEVAVRAKAKLTNTDIGAKLMRKAFDKEQARSATPVSRTPESGRQWPTCSREPLAMRRIRKATDTLRLRIRRKRSSCS